MEDNSIINAVKRLERVGEENSVTIKKLKEATEKVAKKLNELIRPNMTFPYLDDNFHKIVRSLYYFDGMLIWDYDGEAQSYTIDDYLLRPTTGYVKRAVALDFAKAIADGMLDEIADWLEKKTKQNQEAIEKLLTE